MHYVLQCIYVVLCIVFGIVLGRLLCMYYVCSIYCIVYCSIYCIICCSMYCSMCCIMYYIMVCIRYCNM